MEKLSCKRRWIKLYPLPQNPARRIIEERLDTQREGPMTGERPANGIMASTVGPPESAHMPAVSRIKMSLPTLSPERNPVAQPKAQSSLPRSENAETRERAAFHRGYTFFSTSIFP